VDDFRAFSVHQDIVMIETALNLKRTANKRREEENEKRKASKKKQLPPEVGRAEPEEVDSYLTQVCAHELFTALEEILPPEEEFSTDNLQEMVRGRLDTIHTRLRKSLHLPSVKLLFNGSSKSSSSAVRAKLKRLSGKVLDAQRAVPVKSRHMLNLATPVMELLLKFA
jgi:hypothetical protein